MITDWTDIDQVYAAAVALKEAHPNKRNPTENGKPPAVGGRCVYSNPSGTRHCFVGQLFADNGVTPPAWGDDLNTETASDAGYALLPDPNQGVLDFLDAIQNEADGTNA